MKIRNIVGIKLKVDLGCDFVHLFQTLFGKEADRLEQATANESTCILTQSRGRGKSKGGLMKG